MTLFESILKKTENYSKLEYLKQEFQYYWNKFIHCVYYPWDWFKIRFIPKHRYHILDLTKGGNNYHYGWHDTDSRMLQACFLLLVEYVECEKPFQEIDWEYGQKSKEIAAEIRYLYNWWKTDRAAKRAALTKEWDALSPEDSSKFIPVDNGGFTIYIPESHRALKRKEDELEEEDQRNLERLIKIRGWLWT